MGLLLHQKYPQRRTSGKNNRFNDNFRSLSSAENPVLNTDLYDTLPVPIIKSVLWIRISFRADPDPVFFYLSANPY